MALPVPYLEMSLAFVVKDHLRDQFSHREAIQALDAPKIAVPGGLPYYVDVVRKMAPKATLVSIKAGLPSGWQSLAGASVRHG